MPKEKRLALITGGSRGIGKVIAERLQPLDFHLLTPTRAELDFAFSCEEFAESIL